MSAEKDHLLTYCSLNVEDEFPRGVLFDEEKFRFPLWSRYQLYSPSDRIDRPVPTRIHIIGVERAHVRDNRPRGT